MKYSINKEYITGVAIPVSSLRSEKSCGIGEFSDLKPFGDWCKKVGLDLIQILPVNDTGYQSSPYSALSAFALHPIYLRISEVKEAKIPDNKCNTLKEKWEKKDTIEFNSILKDKLDLLKEIYLDNIKTIKKSKKITKWQNDNPWIKEYAVFSYLKELNDFAPWHDWSNDKHIDENRVEQLFNERIDKLLFYSWIQYNLEEQLKSVTEYLENIGINLKGDLPILMNTDSCDVWYHREIFDIDHRAGAPPDMFSADGQNWGFPTYFWSEMEKDDYKWWKDRLDQASKFYHAYRIDHVLGFFRIWSIPSQFNSGSMGYYRPNKFMTLKDLENIGFSEERIKWLTKAHVPGYELRQKVGHEANEVIKYLLKQIGEEDLYLFNDHITTANNIWQCEELSHEARATMVELYRNITIIKVDDDNYIPSWYFHNTRAYQSLSGQEKHLLSEKLTHNSIDSMNLWKNQGLKLLKFMKESENMLVCAEDLGAVPDCVPEVLEKLGILGLHVTRWSKKYKEPGEPFIKPSEYKYLSVSTPAVHDSTTVRQWWKEIDDLNEVSDALNLNEKLGEEPEPSEVTKMYEALLQTTSQIAMFQFQDLLAIDNNLTTKDPFEERINIPGTSNDKNWSYRIKFTIEELNNNTKFINQLKKLILKRRG